MSNVEMYAKLYAEEPNLLARDQARFTVVVRGHATGDIDSREISVYALRTLSSERLNAVWPHLPKPKPSVHDQRRAAIAKPVPPEPVMTRMKAIQVPAAVILTVIAAFGIAGLLFAGMLFTAVRSGCGQ